ncbi:hypothetical protein ACJMK2_019521 [Sinanodonta woodiana]|uniref:Sodium-dependent glucose transporter 1 n=1 Tax=Sinanodonta woodiana TaxID=1069815 RepID=A0ABD3TYJ8_SINWO
MSNLDDEEGLFRDDSGLLHEDEPVRPRLPQWWHKFFKTLCLSFSFFVLGLCISIPGPTLLDLGERVHADTGPMTLVFTGRSLGYLVGSILGGVLFDHFNKQLLLFFTLFVASFATVAVPWSLTLTVLALLIAIQGIAMGVLDTGGNVFCIRIWGKKNAPYMQTLHFAFGVGAFIAPLLAKPFLSNQGFLEGDNSTRAIKGFIPVVTDISHLVNHSKRFADMELYINSNISFHYDSVINSKLTLHRRESMSMSDINSSELYSSGTNSSSPLTPIPGNSSGSNETFLSINKGLTVSANSGSGLNLTFVSLLSSTSPTLPMHARKPPHTSDRYLDTDNTGLTSSTNSDPVFNSTSVSLTSSTSPTMTTLAKKPVHSSDQYLNMANADGMKIPGHLSNNKPGSAVLEPSKPKEPTEKNRLRDVTPSPGVNETTSSPSRNDSLHASVVLETSKLRNASTENNSNKSEEAGINATESSDVSRITQEVSAGPTKLNGTLTETTTAVTITKSQVKEKTTRSIQTTPKTLPSTMPVSHTSVILPITSMASQSTTKITPSPVMKGTATTETVAATSSAVTQNSKLTDIMPNPGPSTGAHGNTNGSGKIEPKKNIDKGGEGDDINSIKESDVGPQKPKQTGVMDHATEVVKNISKIQFAYLIIGLLLLLNSIMYLVMFCRDRNRYQYDDLHDILRPVCKSRPFYRIFLLTLLFFFFFAYVGMEVTYGGLIATFAVEFSHWSKDQGTVVTAIFWGALATGRGISIFVSKYFHPPCMLVIDLVLMIFGSLVLCTALYAYEPLLWIGTLILGLGMSSVFPAGISWAESRMHLTGKATAVFIVGSALGEMVIPATTGYLYDNYDYIKLMQVMLSLSIFSTVIFTILQCVAPQTVKTVFLKDEVACLSLENDKNNENHRLNEEACELEVVTLGRRNENLRFKSKKGKEYQSLIEDLDDD